MKMCRWIRGRKTWPLMTDLTHMARELGLECRQEEGKRPHPAFRGDKGRITVEHVWRSPWKCVFTRLSVIFRLSDWQSLDSERDSIMSIAHLWSDTTKSTGGCRKAGQLVEKRHEISEDGVKNSFHTMLDLIWWAHLKCAMKRLVKNLACFMTIETDFYVTCCFSMNGNGIFTVFHFLPFPSRFVHSLWTFVKYLRCSHVILWEERLPPVKSFIFDSGKKRECSKWIWDQLRWDTAIKHPLINLLMYRQIFAACFF